MGQPDISVVRGEWVVDREGKAVMLYGQFAQLSGLARLAEIDGLGREDLPGNESTSSGRKVRAGQPDATSGGVNSLEHRRRAIEELHRRIHSVSGSREGKPGRTRNTGRTGDTITDARASDASTTDRSHAGNQSNAQRTRWKAAIEAMTADHLPLTTRHLHQAEVHGFDYYNPKTGKIESGDTSRIALWLLDPDYDGRSLFPRQVFFPMAGDKDGWARLAKNLKAEIDEELIEAYRGNVSLPFDLGPNKRVAVKIVDDRGIESLKVVTIV